MPGATKKLEISAATPSKAGYASVRRSSRSKNRRPLQALNDQASRRNTVAATHLETLKPPSSPTPSRSQVRDTGGHRKSITPSSSSHKAFPRKHISHGRVKKAMTKTKRKVAKKAPRKAAKPDIKATSTIDGPRRYPTRGNAQSKHLSQQETSVHHTLKEGNPDTNLPPRKRECFPRV